MKICNFCNNEYKLEAQVINMWGSKFCLHDEKLLEFRQMNGSLKNDSLSSVKVENIGRNKTEKKYIKDAKDRGNTVVKGSDGLLREIEKS